jgi:hypothetical protein
MKRLLIALAVGLFAVMAVQADDTGHVGRYQLLYAVTETTNPVSTTQTKTVWKIDTVTGQVWQFISVDAGGKIMEHFTPIETSQP